MNIKTLRLRECQLTEQILLARLHGDIEMERVFEGRREIVRRELEKLIGRKEYL